MNEYVEPQVSTWAGHAVSPIDRTRIASGGLVTTLLSFALEHGYVDAVAAVRSDAGLQATLELITEPDQLCRYGKSQYFNVPVERQLKLLDNYQGRIAVCGLPCHVRHLRRLQSQGALQNVTFLANVFCGHNNDVELWDLMLARRGLRREDVTDVRVNRSYLGGNIFVSCEDKTPISISFREFNVFRSLWFFSKDLCRYCDEHLGAKADLSIGDIFTGAFRSRTPKPSALIARSEQADKLVRHAMKEDRVSLEPIPADLIFTAQKRILAPSKDSLSRYHANRLWGYRSKKPTEGRFRWRSFFTYALLIGNNRLSRTRWGQSILRHIPAPLLYPYAAAVKLINNTLSP